MSDVHQKDKPKLSMCYLRTLVILFLFWSVATGASSPPIHHQDRKIETSVSLGQFKLPINFNATCKSNYDCSQPDLVCDLLTNKCKCRDHYNLYEGMKTDLRLRQHYSQKRKRCESYVSYLCTRSFWKYDIPCVPGAECAYHKYVETMSPSSLQGDILTPNIQEIFGLCRCKEGYKEDKEFRCQKILNYNKKCDSDYDCDMPDLVCDHDHDHVLGVKKCRCREFSVGNKHQSLRFSSSRNRCESYVGNPCTKMVSPSVSDGYDDEKKWNVHCVYKAECVNDDRNTSAGIGTNIHSFGQCHCMKGYQEDGAGQCIRSGIKSGTSAASDIKDYLNVVLLIIPHVMAVMINSIFLA